MYRRLVSWFVEASGRFSRFSDGMLTAQELSSLTVLQGCVRRWLVRRRFKAILRAFVLTTFVIRYLLGFIETYIASSLFYYYYYYYSYGEGVSQGGALAIKTRNSYIQTFFNRHQQYSTRLSALMFRFKKRLIESCNSKFRGRLRIAQVNVIFGNIEELYSQDHKFGRQFQKCMNRNYPFLEIGPASVSLDSTLRAYMLYVLNYNRAQETLRVTLKKIPGLKKFIQRLSQVRTFDCFM